MKKPYRIILSAFLFTLPGNALADATVALNCKERLLNARKEMVSVVPGFNRAEIVARPNYMLIHYATQNQRFVAKILPLVSVRRRRPPGPWLEITGGFEDFSGFDERWGRMFENFKGLVGAREKRESVRGAFFRIFKAAIEECVPAAPRPMQLLR